MMRWNRFILTLVSAFILILAIAGCGGGGSGGTSNEEVVEDIVIPDSTKVLDESTLQNLSTVSTDGSTFTFDQSTAQLDALSEDDVIVFGVTNLTPYGALRKVSSITISGDDVVLQTTLATLEDAIQEGTISVSKTLSPDDVTTSLVLVKGVTFGDGFSSSSIDKEFPFTMNDVILYDRDNNKNTTYDQIVANGHVTFPISFNFVAKISWFKMKKIDFKVKIGNKEKEFSKLEISSKVEIDEEKEVEIARHYFPPITASIVILTPILTVSVGVSGNVSVGISTSVSQKAEFGAGLNYDKNKWSKSWEPTKNEYVFDPPTFDAGCYAKAYTRPNLDLLIYGLVGPNIAIEGYFELIVGDTNIEEALASDDKKGCPENNASSWALCGGLDVNGGVKLKGFSWLLDDYTAEPPIYSIRKTILESGTLPDTDPIPEITRPTTLLDPFHIRMVEIEEGSSLYFEGSVDQGNPPFTYQWDFGGGAPDLTAVDLKKKIPGNAIFPTPGTYDVKFKVRESDSTDIIWYEDTIQVEVTPGILPPTAIIISPAENVTIHEGGDYHFEGSRSEGKEPITYLWDFDGGAPDLQPEYLVGSIIGLVKFPTAGVYTVSFTVTDANNDSDTETRIVTVEAIDDFDDYVQDIMNATNYNNPSLEISRISTQYLDDGLDYDNAVQDVYSLYSTYTVSNSTYTINQIISNDETNAVINRTRTWRLTDDDSGCVYDESWSGDKSLIFEDEKWKDYGNQKSEERDPSVVQAVACESIQYSYQLGATEACDTGPGKIVTEFSGFTGEDKPMYVFVGLKDLKGIVPLKMDWIEPSGDVFYSYAIDLAGDEFRYRSYDEYSYVWVDENYASLFAGKWKVKIYVGGALRKTVEFTYSP